MKRLLMFAACSLLWIAPAQAQTCLGTLPFEQGQMRVRGDALFGSDVHIFGAGLAKGFENLFAGGGLILQGFSGGGGLNLGFYGAGGRQYPVGTGNKYFACPVVTVARVSFDGGSNTLLNFAGNVGFEVPTTGTTKIFPTFAASLSHERIGNSLGGTFSETFLNIHAGVGLVFNEKMSLVPEVVIPIGSDLVDPMFGVNFNLKVGAN